MTFSRILPLDFPELFLFLFFIKMVFEASNLSYMSLFDVFYGLLPEEMNETEKIATLRKIGG